MIVQQRLIKVFKNPDYVSKMVKRSLLEKVAETIADNKWKLVSGVVVALIVSLVFGVPLKVVIILPLIILIASFSTFYFNYISLPVNFELVKVSTILVAVSYGIIPGLIVGMASTIFGKALIGRIDDKLPLSILTISAIAVGAFVFSGASIVTLGIALVVAYNVSMLVLSMFLGGDLAWNIPYEGTNLFFNIMIFAKIAPVLLTLMA
jgi:hypothetical protein